MIYRNEKWKAEAPEWAKILNKALLYMRIHLGILTLAVVLLMGTALRSNSNILKNIQKFCDFYVHVSQSEIPPTITRLGAQILIDSRNAAVDAKCTDNLGPIPIEMQELARKYKLQIRG